MNSGWQSDECYEKAEIQARRKPKSLRTDTENAFLDSLDEIKAFELQMVDFRLVWCVRVGVVVYILLIISFLYN